MENHGLVHTMTKKLLRVQLEIPKIPHNLYGPWPKSTNWDIFVKKPASHVHCLCEGASLEMQQIYNNKIEGTPILKLAIVKRL